MTNGEKFKDLLQRFERDLGFHQAQWVPLSRPFSFEIYSEWIRNNQHAEMKYLADHLPFKENPQLKWPQARSAFVFLASYFPQTDKESFPLKQTRVALYAQGRDYHFWFREKLEQAIRQLQSIYPQEYFIAATDSVPLIERDLAARGGLGWIGKNNCLIHPQKGSLFFIGEIITSLEPQTDQEPQRMHDFCGTCRRCIDICPTNAIQNNRTLDANRCIAYWTIESRQLPPLEIREKIGDHFFGCDLCQTVCPWNQKVFKNLLETTTKRELSITQRDLLVEEMKMILTSSGKSLEKLFSKTPLSRAGSFGLKRNALVVVANHQLRECRQEVASLQQHHKLSELAQWCLRELLKT